MSTVDECKIILNDIRMFQESDRKLDWKQILVALKRSKQYSFYVTQEWLRIENYDAIDKAHTIISRMLKAFNN